MNASLPRAALLLIIIGIGTLASSADHPPNIVFLFADDQRADTIAAHGNPHIDTPNLDGLAAEGLSFRKNYCAGSFSGAVCVASRAMLMTGRHWMRIGDGEKPKPATDWKPSEVLPALLKRDAGYAPYIVGKWHNGKGTLDLAFAEGRSVYMGGMADHTDFEVQDLSGGKLGAKHAATEFSSTEFANGAIDFLTTAKTDQPFFLYVAFMAPHDPRNPSEPYRQRYYDDRPPLPENFLPQHPFNNVVHTQSGRDEGLAPWPRTEQMISDQLCEYYGLVTHLDEQVGRVIEAIKSSPHADNTIIVYTADHGLAMGSHGLLGKQNVYEHSMHCPLILRGPGIPAGQSTEAFTYIHDLYATLCDLAGVEIPEAVDAQSLIPLIKGEADRVHDTVLLPFQDNQFALIDGGWKYHIYPKIGHQMLFHLKDDPAEMSDLSGDNYHQEKKVFLRLQMHRWLERLGDDTPLYVENVEPKEPIYDNSKRVLDIWQPEWIRNKYFGGRDTPSHGKAK